MRLARCGGVRLWRGQGGGVRVAAHRRGRASPSTPMLTAVHCAPAWKKDGRASWWERVGWCQMESAIGWAPPNHTFHKSGSATKETTTPLVERDEDG